MSPELDKQICERFPKICVNRHKSPRESCFAFGFEFSQGWSELVIDLFTFIQQRIDSSEKYGRPIPQFVVAQAKEKFSELVIHYDGGDDTIRGAVEFAEFLSNGICEECGTTKNIGKTTKGWMKTVCINCVSSINNTGWKSNP